MMARPRDLSPPRTWSDFAVLPLLRSVSVASLPRRARICSPSVAWPPRGGPGGFADWLRWGILRGVRCSALLTRCSALLTRCSALLTRCSALLSRRPSVARRSLLSRRPSIARRSPLPPPIRCSPEPPPPPPIHCSPEPPLPPPIRCSAEPPLPPPGGHSLLGEAGRRPSESPRWRVSCSAAPHPNLSNNFSASRLSTRALSTSEIRAVPEAENQCRAGRSLPRRFAPCRRPKTSLSARHQSRLLLRATPISSPSSARHQSRLPPPRDTNLVSFPRDPNLSSPPEPTKNDGLLRGPPRSHSKRVGGT